MSSRTRDIEIDGGVGSETTPRCRAALQGLFKTIDELCVQTEGVEGRFSAVLAIRDVPPPHHDARQERNEGGLLADEIFLAMRRLGSVVDHLASLRARCEL